MVATGASRIGKTAAAPDACREPLAQESSVIILPPGPHGIRISKPPSLTTTACCSTVFSQSQNTGTLIRSRAPTNPIAAGKP